MHFRLSRRGVRIACIAGGVVFSWALVLFSFGPIVRSAARSRAERRHVELDIGAVRPGWFCVRLLDVAVRPQGMPSLSVHVDQLRVAVTAGFHVEQLDLQGVEVAAHGSADQLREEYEAWRDLSKPDLSHPSDPSARPAVLVHGLGLRWEDGEHAEPRALVEGGTVDWRPDLLHVEAPKATLRAGPAAVSFTDGSADIDPSGSITRARAAALDVELVPATRSPGATSAQGVALAAAGTSIPVAHDPTPAADPGAPLFAVPDTHSLRTKVAVLAAVLSTRIREGADLGVDALTWKIQRDPDQVAFTLGPGPLTLTRSATAFEVRFSTDPHVASTPLAAHALLPARGDPGIWVEGGPVSLSLLGVREGAAGLVDVAHATVTGRAHTILADDGSSLTFEGEAGTRGLSISNPRLATEVVRGLDVQLRARGEATAEGDLRFDDLAATVGAVHVAAGGALEQRPDHVAGAFHFDMPNAPCQALLDSLPAALLPVLQGTRIGGSLGATGRFAFDTRSLDDLELDYQVRDQCKVLQVPPELAREHFQQPFNHRIYLPDGTVAEESTGPGSDDWTPLDEISPYMQVAVLTTEDGAFPKHHGFNRASIRASLIANLKARRFARGASTITMQLAKNLFLARDKTLARKLEEVVLTDYLEQTFSKDELMELYLNVIEFGPLVYGITPAAQYYFGRTPAELNLAECLFLSSLLPAPLRYGQMRENGEVPEGWMKLLRSLMQVAHHYGRITDEELAEAEKENVVFWRGGERPAPRPPVRARTDFDGNTEDVFTAPPLDGPSN